MSTEPKRLHFPHTLPACLVFGLIAMVVALVPLGAALVVFAMAALGLGTVVRSLKKWGAHRQRKRAVLWIAGVFGLCTLFVEGYGPAAWLVVCTGALTHVLGDWLTRSGVPLAWPFVVRGKRWWMLSSPVAFHTGKSRVGALIGFPIMLALGAPSTPVA